MKGSRCVGLDGLIRVFGGVACFSRSFPTLYSGQVAQQLLLTIASIQMMRAGLPLATYVHNVVCKYKKTFKSFEQMIPDNTGHLTNDVNMEIGRRQDATFDMRLVYESGFLSDFLFVVLTEYFDTFPNGGGVGRGRFDLAAPKTKKHVALEYITNNLRIACDAVGRAVHYDGGGAGAGAGGVAPIAQVIVLLFLPFMLFWKISLQAVVRSETVNSEKYLNVSTNIEKIGDMLRILCSADVIRKVEDQLANSDLSEVDLLASSLLGIPLPSDECDLSLVRSQQFISTDILVHPWLQSLASRGDSPPLTSIACERLDVRSAERARKTSRSWLGEGASVEAPSGENALEMHARVICQRLQRRQAIVKECLVLLRLAQQLQSKSHSSDGAVSRSEIKRCLEAQKFELLVDMKSTVECLPSKVPRMRALFASLSIT